jgi:8-oxo-dGTP diphosphatase
VAVVVIDGEFLVIRRSQSVIAPGAYCFPGGAIEPGETEEAALRREMMEELSVAARPVRRLWRSVTGRQVQLAWWLTELETLGRLRPNASEVASVHWMTPAEMLDLPELLDSNLEFLDFLSASGFSGISMHLRDSGNHRDPSE